MANMSRLIVKNLPKTVTEDTLRKLFGEKGTVTDVQLKFTPEGKFRKFAFVGYQTENEADEAIESFNKTFINTSRITVEKCSVLGDENKPKAWSKYAPDNATTKKVLESEEAANDKKTTKKKKKEKKDTDETIELLQKYKDDPFFEEFLQVHAPDETAKLHQIKTQKSEKGDSGQESGSDSEVDDAEAVKLANEEISDLEYMKQLMKGEGERKPRQKMEKKVKEKVKLFTVKLRDLPYNVKKKDIKQFFKPLTCFSIRIPRQVHGFAYVGFKTENLLKKALLKDRSFIKGKRVSVVKYEQNDNLSGMVEDNPVKNKWKSQEEGLKNEEDIAESGMIFFRNLAYTTTEDDLEKLFSKYGPLAGINVPVDKTTKKLKGFGTVTFLMPEHAVKAYSELDGSVLHGRMLHLLPGKSKDTAEDNIEESSNFKKKKAAKQKAQAGSTHNWNSLFLGHDAVAEVIADAYGTTKEAVVGPNVQGSAAVRLALGETQIVAETRKYLEEQGVLLDAFANVSNVPSTSVQPVQAMTTIQMIPVPSSSRSSATEYNLPVRSMPGPSSQPAQSMTMEVIPLPSKPGTSTEYDLPLDSLPGSSSTSGQKMFSPSTSRSSSAASQHSSTPRSKKSKSTKTAAEEAYKKFAETAVELNQHVASISGSLNSFTELMTQTMTGLLEERKKTNALIARQNELLFQLLENVKK